MAEQEIRFTQLDDRRIAWAAVGDGPELVVGGWWMSHLELNWRDPRFRAYIETLAQYRTVIRYDRPGTGLSEDGGPPPAGLDEEVAALGAVIDAAGAAQVEAYSGSSGGPVALAYAAANPTRFTKLLCYGTYANGAEIADPRAQENIVWLIREHWGLGSRVLADVFLPTAGVEERVAFANFQRNSEKGEVAARSLESVYSLDVRDWLDAVETPVTVLHRRGDTAIPFALGRDLAARIPEASFVALEGDEHFPWRGDSAALVRVVLERLGVEEPIVELQPAPEPSQPMADAEIEVAETDLSRRELEVLRLVAIGLGDREIAEELVVSPHTVHRHVANIRTKLRLPSRAAAAAHAARLDLI